MAGHERRRRIDRVTAEDYLADIDAADAATLRAMRDECREEEARLSYARRVLHGQLDIVRAEMARRGDVGSEDLIASLTAVLADRSGPSDRSVGLASVYTPSESGRRTDDQQLEQAPLGRLPDLDNDALADVAGALTTAERETSRQRAVVLAHLDRLQDELIARYRDGGVAVDEIVDGVTGS